MRQPRAITVVLASVALLLTACGTAADDPPPAGDDAEQGAPDNDQPDEGEAPADLREFTDLAVEDAAAERGVAEEEIEVVRSEEVDWPDGSRGCPREGEVYTQAIVPGHLVVLDVAGEQLHYHGAENEPPFHCDDPQEPADT